MPGGARHRLPVRVPRELLRPAPRGRAGLGALLHAPQDHGGTARPVHAVRQPPGARDGSRDGRLDLPLGLEARRRTDGPGPRRRIRRHERFPLRARGRDRRAELSRARLAFRPRPDLRPARRGSRRAARPPREHPDPEDHRRGAPVGDDRGSARAGGRVVLLDGGRLETLVRDRRDEQRGGVADRSGPARLGARRLHAGVLLHLQHAQAHGTRLRLDGRSRLRGVRGARALQRHPRDAASLRRRQALLRAARLGLVEVLRNAARGLLVLHGDGSRVLREARRAGVLPRRRRNLGQPLRRLAAHLAGAGSRPHAGHALSRGARDAPEAAPARAAPIRSAPARSGLGRQRARPASTGGPRPRRWSRAMPCSNGSGTTATGWSGRFRCRCAPCRCRTIATLAAVAWGPIVLAGRLGKEGLTPATLRAEPTKPRTVPGAQGAAGSGAGSRGDAWPSGSVDPARGRSTRSASRPRRKPAATSSSCR